MKKKLLPLIAIFLIIPFFKLFAQSQEAITYRSGFLNFYHRVPDSAVTYAHKLASNPDYAPYLREALHGDFSVYFSELAKFEMWERAKKNKFTDEVKFNTDYDALIATCYSTLEKMATGQSGPLKDSTLPMYYWVTLQKNKRNNQKIAELIKSFIHTELQKNDLFQNRTARYALLIYKEIAQNKQLEPLAHELLSATINKLRTLQVNTNVNLASNLILEKRAWYRFLYASANYLMAERLLEKTENEKASIFFEVAMRYSPDITDLNRQNDYSQEVYLFANKKIDLFQHGYLQHLEANGVDKERKLSALSEMAIRNPSAFKSLLEAFYTRSGSSTRDFQAFWEEKLNYGLDKAPPFKLKLLNGGTYSSVEHNGKWTLVDFWGTWCGPCREEHPDLQKFYLSTLSELAGKITVLTVACNDTEKAVNDYMSKFNYSFPVAMRDNKIEKTFNIKGFPTKILISPQGNYLVIPDTDWVSFIKHYASF